MRHVYKSASESIIVLLQETLLEFMQSEMVDSRILDSGDE
jgi:hypothetical protein